MASAVNIEPVKVWLERKLDWGMLRCALGGIACLLAGLLVLFISFWASYMAIWFISNSFFPLRHHTSLLIAGAFMTLVVIVGARQNLEQLDPLESQVQLSRDMDITLTPWTRYGMSYSTNAVKAGVFEVRTFATAINLILCGGVILLFGSVRGIRRFRRLRSLDMDGCARVLTLLVGAAHRQSFEEIVNQLPGLNPVRVFDDLHWIDGVLFLANDPPGLTLLAELRNELSRGML